MDKRAFLFTTIPALLLLLVAVIMARPGPSAAQGPGSGGGVRPNRGVQPNTPTGPGFTYQGRLRDGGGGPVDSTCDLTFGLWDAESGGSQVGSDSVVSGVAVSDGYFAALVNGGGEFGAGAFAGEERWLEIAVQCSGDPSPVVLSPRQMLSAAPYALYALSVTPHDHWGQSWSGSGTGLTLAGGDVGLSGSGSSYGVYGVGGIYGVSGESASTAGCGVIGSATAIIGQTFGVRGESASTSAGSSGVFGYASATSGPTFGVFGSNASTSGRGVVGYASAASGTTFGVFGSSASTSGSGVYGYASATSGATYGLYGETDSTSGSGVYGYATASSGETFGVYGLSDSTGGRGVYGYATASSSLAFGVFGVSDSTSGKGVFGHASATSGLAYGVLGVSDSTQGRGVVGYANAASGGTIGVWGQTVSPSGFAGYFQGNVQVTGSLSKGGGGFKIDHPLDPANRYLYHSFVESPDMKNVYDGVVLLDEQGSAWVELPAWFETLNRDFRYQLTPIGAPAPSLYIAHKVQDNRFQIAGGIPGLEVSWLVTGVRQDPWAEANRIPVEVDKPADEQGTYLHPDLYDQPEELGLDYQRNHGWEAPAGPDARPPDAVPE